MTVLPLYYLVERSAARGWSFVISEVTDDRTLTLIGRSLALVGTVTIACVIIGTGLAVLVTRTTLPGRRVVGLVLALPLALPSYVVSYLWISEWPGLAGFWGACLMLTLVSYPYVLMPAVAAITRVDPSHEEVARSLGFGAFTVLVRVTLRQARAAIAAGGLLVALYVLSDFGAIAAMRYEAFTWVIYGAYRSGFNPSRAAVLSLVLLAFAALLVVAESRARGRAAAYRVGGGTPRPAPLLELGRRWPLAAIPVLVVAVVALVFPLVGLVRWMQRSLSAAVEWQAIGAALGTSLTLSVVTAVLCVVLGLPVGILAARHRDPLSRSVERITYVAHGLPGIVIGISMVSVGVLLLRPVYLETPLLLLAYVVLLTPLVVGSIRSAVEASPVRWEEVGRSLGGGPVRSFVGITGRLAGPGIAAGGALVFLACMKELPMTLLLHPTGTSTLATELWQYASVSDYGTAAPYAAALVLFAAVPTAVLGWWSGRAGDVRGI